MFWGEFFFYKKSILQLFSTDAMAFSKKFFLEFFAPENMEKNTQKVAHDRSQLFFQYWPDCPNGPKTKSPLMQNWVFRLDWGLR